MNIICMPVNPLSKYIVPAGKLLFEELVRKPVVGAVEIANGLRLSVPELVKAAKDAIASKLTADARAKVQQGFDRMVQGWRLLRGPLLVIVLIVACGWKGALLTIVIGSMLTAVLA